MGNVRSVIIIEVLPSLKFGIEIQIIRERQQLKKLRLISSVRTFNFAIQLRGSWFDIYMPHPQVFDMPVKTGLEFVPPIGSNCADPKRKLFDHIIHELDRTLLVVFRKDPQCTNSGRIIDGCVLKPFQGPSFAIF